MLFLFKLLKSIWSMVKLIIRLKYLSSIWLCMVPLLLPLIWTTSCCDFYLNEGMYRYHHSFARNSSSCHVSYLLMKGKPIGEKFVNLIFQLATRRSLFLLGESHQIPFFWRWVVFWSFALFLELSVTICGC